MEIGKLTVTSRDAIGKGPARQLRKQGYVPGICYGAGLEEPLKIIVSPKALKASLDPSKKQNTVISVVVEDAQNGNRSLTAMLWDYQIDAIKREVTHVDLIAIDPEKEIETEVPVVTIGKAAGLVDGGVLNFARHSVEVLAKPGNIPNEFELDITTLKIGENRHVSDLTVPPGVKMVTSPKSTLVTCVAPRADKATEVAAVAEVAVDPKAAAGKPAAKKEGEGDKK